MLIVLQLDAKKTARALPFFCKVNPKENFSLLFILVNLESYK